MSFARIIFLFFFTAWALVAPIGVAWAAADPSNPGILEIKDPNRYERVVAISDVHARYGSVEELLQAYSLIDENGHWAGGKTLFIVVGDSLNKGKKSIKLLDLWIRLQEEAKVSGGRLVHTLGNHEANVIAKDKSFLRNHPEFTSDLKHRNLTLSQLLHRGGKRGRFLHGMPAGVRVGNVLFLHSGLPPDLTWAGFVRQTRKEVRAGRYDSNFMLGKNSILDSSGWAEDPKKLNEVAVRMKKMGLSTIVFGHDASAFGKVDKIESIKVVEGGAPSKLIVKIDTGMGKKISEGRLLFFGTPDEMKGRDPPSNLRYTSRKRTKLKRLRPCENFFAVLGD